MKTPRQIWDKSGLTTEVMNQISSMLEAAGPGVPSKATFDGRLALAKSNVSKFDKIEGVRDRSLVMILDALETGLRSPETNCHFEALVMLKDAIRTERQGGTHHSEN